MNSVMALSDIKNLIYHIRGKAVMLDSDLADLYGIDTRSLNQAVRRNVDRFPDDFMFQLTRQEFDNLISQIVTSSSHGGRRKMPLAFTEQGVAMLSSALHSDTAIKTNIAIMRVFVQIRRLGMTTVDIRHKIDCMEKKYDRQFKVVFDAIRQLIDPPPIHKKKDRMGFAPPEKK